MDNEQILLDLYKQQQYNQTRSRLQKVFLTVSGAGSAVAMIGSILYFVSWLYVLAFGGTVLCVSLTVLLTKLKRMQLTTACFVTLLYSCFIFIPPFWFQTGITGSAPYVSIIILVSIVTLFAGKTLKWLLPSYLLVLAGLVIYSALLGLPKTDHPFTLFYNIAGFVFASGSIVLYMLFKQKEFNELNDKFLRSSFRDELTQLYNRKLLDLILEYLEGLYKREAKDYILVMFDVDDFKEMNDQHGHVFGDIVLRSISECIQSTTRTSDFVVRYGGDEILVIQSNATESSIQTFISRIVALMKTSCQLEIPIGVSFGFAMRSDCDSPEATLKLADERLYRHKAEKKASH